MFRKQAHIGLYIAMGTALTALEFLVPLPLPWLKPGLANLVTLLALSRWGTKETLFIVMMRIFLSALITGRFLQPGFFMSLAGGVSAALVMAVLFRWRGRIFSLVGISVTGAVVHNTAQLATVYLLFIRHARIVSLLPWLLVTALAAGILVGTLGMLILRRLEGAGAG